MAADQLDKLDYYTLLGVESDATTDEIKRAFRKFALRYHPDRHVESGPEAVARATTKLRDHDPHSLDAMPRRVDAA